MRNCGGCHHFFSVPNGPGECRLLPPQTTVFLVGFHPATKTPQFHKEFSYPLTSANLWCSHWTMIKATADNMVIDVPK